MKRSVSEAAKCAGISVRTLHYYDSIGLLCPSEVTDAGYRYYDDDAMSRLQQILFFRELEFSLHDIADILSRPDYDQTEILRRHRTLLQLKRDRLDALIELVDSTIGGNPMKHKPYTDIHAAKQAYAKEAAQRWGKTDAYAESQKKHAAYTDEKENAIQREAEEIFSSFAAHMDHAPSEPVVQQLVQRWRDHITAHHYNCTVQILSGLGMMYVADERFAENLNRFGDGNAQFMSDAIAYYCAHNQ